MLRPHTTLYAPKQPQGIPKYMFLDHLGLFDTSTKGLGHRCMPKGGKGSEESQNCMMLFMDDLWVMNLEGINLEGMNITLINPRVVRVAIQGDEAK